MYLCISIELHTSFYRVEPTIQAENDFIASSLVPQQLEIESIGRKKKKKKYNTTLPKTAAPHTTKLRVLLVFNKIHQNCPQTQGPRLNS